MADFVINGALISDMSRGQLQNIIVHLSKKQEEYTKYNVGNYEIDGKAANEWITILREEWKSRD